MPISSLNLLPPDCCFITASRSIASPTPIAFASTWYLAICSVNAFASLGSLDLEFVCFCNPSTMALKDLLRSSPSEPDSKALLRASMDPCLPKPSPIVCMAILAPLPCLYWLSLNPPLSLITSPITPTGALTNLPAFSPSS